MSSTPLQQVHARENENVVAAVLPEARELGFEIAVSRLGPCRVAT